MSVSQRPAGAEVGELLSGNGMILPVPQVRASEIDRQVLAERGADVILLDGRRSRPTVVYRAIVRIRAAGWTRGILLLLDSDDLPTVSVASSVGATDFVLAPASQAELEARLRRQVLAWKDVDTRPDPEPETGIQLHWRMHQVSFEGRTIGLTLRELQLLAVFIEHGGRIVTANDLGRLAWGHSKRSRSGLATTYVCSLRKKLAWFGGRFGIQTVHGVGYRFVV